jgi:hypothetical protein
MRRFTVKGHKGKNRVRLAARGLGVGTYRISASTTSGRLVRRATVVVLADSTPTAAQVAAARAADVCASYARLTSGSATNDGPTSLAPGHETRNASAPGGTPSTEGPGGVLGSAVQKTARAIRPWLVALLVFAIALLAVGSVPQLAGTRDTRLNDFLARRRVELVAVGAASFAAVIIAILLG